MEEQEYNVIAAEEFQEIHTVLNDPVNRYLVSAVEFDPLEELLWVGSQSGHLTSYYGTQLHKYTAFQGHNADVLQVVADPYGVLSLMSSQVRYTTRQGLKVFAANDEILQDMQAMVYHDESNVLIAGHQEYFCDLDLTTGEIKQRDVKVEPGVVVMKHSSHFLCCGDSKGVVTLRDPESLSPVHTLEAHNGALSDFDVHGNLLVTCGFSTRYGHLAVDRHLMVYDLRTMRAFPPLQVPIEPFMIKFMPTYTTRCMVISQIGQFLICQPRSLIDQPVIYNINMEGALLMDCSVSSSYQSIAFGDTAGCVHLWGDRHIDELVFNAFSQPTLFPDEVQPLPHVAIDDWSVPLSSFLLPECNEPLLSDWPEHMCVKADRRTPEIDPDILKNMTIRQSVGYAPNPKKKLRNEVVYKANQRTRLNSRGQPVDSPMCKDASETAVPKMYKKVEIKYSKYGIEDFDFFQYNQTNFAGLEIHIPNAYCNSMLQVLYFIEPLRVSMQNHTCEKEFCLACELGYLFKMLDDTEGQTCQASNFLRAFRTLPDAFALGLVLSDADESKGQHNLGRLIQSWHRFVLQELHQDTLAEEKKDTDGESMPVTKSPIQDFFASEFQIINQCKCGNECTRDSTSFLFDLVYPENGKDGSFLSVLQSSITRQQTMQAWCEECQKYQATFQTKKFKSAPDVLGINCQLEQEKDFDFWRRQLEIATGKRPQKVNHSPPKPCRYGKFCNRPGCRFYHGRVGELGQSSTEEGKPWVPLFFWMKLDNESGELELMPSRDEADKSTPGIWYHLSASIVSITDLNGDNNLVAHINVGPTFHERKEGITRKQWYVFNDFAITPIFETEAVEFNLDWKVPCVLFYSRVDLEARHDLNVYPQMDYRVLTADKSLAQRQSRFSRHFTPLNATELPKEGDIVGIDAEFVTLNQEEAEMRSDGTLSTVKPSQMSVARITVVRGWGPLSGVPFIDDYISTSEQVVDYLTKFSGIKPGDLDANMSSKHLTTLKTTYQKLRYLVENNIIFVGHGLKKDFRVINIVVPRNQVIDTVELFHLPKQRFVSLKFLAWHFLNIKIQAGNHDSAEDAYTALKLYNKYKELTARGDAHFEEELQMLYDTGRQLGWQVPD